MLPFIVAVHAGSVKAMPPPNKSVNPQQHQFSQMDSNNDDYVSYDEFLSWHSLWLEWKFQHMDSDGDGYLSGDEFHMIGGSGKGENIRREEVGQGAPLK